MTEQHTPTVGVAQIVERDEVNDARRFAWIVKNPDAARHLLNLLQRGKGDEESFCRMVDRIERSEAAARATS